MSKQILWMRAVMCAILIANTAYAQSLPEKTPSTGRDYPTSSIGEIDTTVAEKDSTLIKSENTALNYSLLLTLVPTATLVLAAPGLIIGPSTGYFYAGMPGRAWTGIGIRVVGIGGMISSFAICGWDCGPGDKAYNIAWAAFLSGAAITVGSAIYDIGTVKKAVRRKNEELTAAHGRLVPAYFADSKAFGLKIHFSF